MSLSNPIPTDQTADELEAEINALQEELKRKYQQQNDLLSRTMDAVLNEVERALNKAGISGPFVIGVCPGTNMNHNARYRKVDLKPVLSAFGTPAPLEFITESEAAALVKEGK